MFRRVVFVVFKLVVIAAFIPFHVYAQDNSEFVIQLDPSSEILVSGNVTVGRIRFLTHGEYTQQFYENKLSPLDIVVIDQFPTELDPFPLAGVIAESPVQSGCHMERQAKQIQIPFLTFKNASSNMILKKLSKVNGLISFEVDPLQKALKIKTNISNQEAENIFRSRIKSISIPEYEEPYDVIQPLRDVPKDKLEHYGQKLSNLYMASNGMHYWVYPDVIGIPGDVGLELQRSTYIRINGKKITLEKAIRLQMEKINNLDLFSDEVPAVLNEIQSWIDQISYNPKIFGRLISLIDTRFKKEGGIFASLRFRSSNRVENEIGAGVYRSLHLKYNELISREARIQEIFRNYIEVQKSLYTTRAYLLRRMFGLNESLTDIACGVHVSKDELKANGIASLEEVNKYKILKIVSHPSEGSGTSPTSDGFYEIAYVIKDPNGKIYFSPDGFISSLDHFSPNLKTISNEDIKLLFREMIKSKENWRQIRSRIQDSTISFEWGITKKNSPVIFDVKVSKDNVEEIIQTRSEFNVEPIYNDILNKLGFREFYDSLKEQSSDQNKSQYDTKIPYLFVKINNIDVLLTFSLDRSHENAFQLILDNFKNQDVKLLSAGTVKATTRIDQQDNIKIRSAIMSETKINHAAKLNLTDSEAKSLLFSIFASFKLRIDGFAPLNVTKADPTIKTIVKQLFVANNLKKSDRLDWLVQFLRKDAYGNSVSSPNAKPFSNISSDVAKVLSGLGLTDFNEIVLNETQEYPFLITTATSWHILMTIDGIPQMVVFRWNESGKLQDIINNIQSGIEDLKQKHEIKILQFGHFGAEVTYPNKILSFDFSTSMYSRNEITLETLLMFIEAIRSNKIEFTPQTRFVTKVFSDAHDVLMHIFPNRKLESITFDDIIQEGKKRGLISSMVKVETNTNSKLSNESSENILPWQIVPFADISSEVAKMFIGWGLKDFSEAISNNIFYSEPIDHIPHLLVTVDGLPKIITFPFYQGLTHKNIINSIESSLSILDEKHEIKILQFGYIDASMSPSNELLSIKLKSSEFFSKEITFEAIFAFVKALQSYGLKFTPETHFEGSYVEVSTALESVFGSKKVETITFDEIIREGEKKGFNLANANSAAKNTEKDTDNHPVQKNGGDFVIKGLAISAALQLISQHVSDNGLNSQETANFIFTSTAIIPEIMKQWQALPIREQMKYTKKFAQLAIQYAGKDVFNAVKNRAATNAADAAIATRNQFGHFAAALFFASFFQTLDHALANDKLSFDDFTQWLTSLPQESIRFLTFSGGSAAASGMMKLMGVLQVKALALPEMQSAVKVYGIGFIRNQVLMATGMLVNKLIFGYQGSLTDSLVHELGNFIKADIVIEAAKITIRSLASGKLILNVAKRPGLAGFMATAVELGGKIFLSGKFAEWESTATLSRHMSLSWYALQQSFLASDLEDFKQKISGISFKSNLDCLKNIHWESLSPCLSSELLQSLQSYLLAAQFQPLYVSFTKHLQSELALEKAYGVVLHTSGLGDMRILRNAERDIYHTIPDIKNNIDEYRYDLNEFFNAQTSEITTDNKLKVALEQSRASIREDVNTFKKCSAEEWSLNIFKCIDQEIVYENAILTYQIAGVENVGLRYLNGKNGRVSDATEYESNSINELTGNAPNGYIGRQYKTSQFLRGLLLQATNLCHDVNLMRPENSLLCMSNAKYIFSFVQNVTDSLTDKKKGGKFINAMMGKAALQLKISETTWFAGAKVSAQEAYPMMAISNVASLMGKTPGVIVFSRFDNMCSVETLVALSQATSFIAKRKLNEMNSKNIQKFWKKKNGCESGSKYRLPTEKEWEDYKKSQLISAHQSQFLIPILRVVNQNAILNNHAAPDGVISLSSQEINTLQSIMIQ